MCQPEDVCGATAGHAHPLVSDVISVRELFSPSFALANGACLSCDCTKSSHAAFTSAQRCRKRKRQLLFKAGDFLRLY